MHVCECACQSGKKYYNIAKTNTVDVAVHTKISTRNSSASSLQYKFTDYGIHTSQKTMKNSCGINTQSLATVQLRTSVHQSVLLSTQYFVTLGNNIVLHSELLSHVKTMIRPQHKCTVKIHNHRAEPLKEISSVHRLCPTISRQFPNKMSGNTRTCIALTLKATDRHIFEFENWRKM